MTFKAPGGSMTDQIIEWIEAHGPSTMLTFERGLGLHGRQASNAARRGLDLGVLRASCRGPRAIWSVVPIHEREEAQAKAAQARRQAKADRLAPHVEQVRELVAVAKGPKFRGEIVPPRSAPPFRELTAHDALKMGVAFHAGGAAPRTLGGG